MHKEEKRAMFLMLETCEGRRGRDRPKFLTELLASLDAGQCRAPAAAALAQKSQRDILTLMERKERAPDKFRTPVTD